MGSIIYAEFMVIFISLEYLYSYIGIHILYENEKNLYHLMILNLMHFLKIMFYMQTLLLSLELYQHTQYILLHVVQQYTGAKCIIFVWTEMTFL